MGRGETVVHGIRAERKRLDPVRNVADFSRILGQMPRGGSLLLLADGACGSRQAEDERSVGVARHVDDADEGGPRVAAELWAGTIEPLAPAEAVIVGVLDVSVSVPLTNMIA